MKGSILKRTLQNFSWIALFAMLIGTVAQAQSPAPQSATATAVLTAKVIAIDYDTRIVTLQDTHGNVQAIKAGSEVQRLNALKVGDIITFTYQESIAYGITKPGAMAPTGQSTPTITRTAGDKPGGTMSQTQVATVTIQAIDAATPSVTIKTQDGRSITMLVNDKANLVGLKIGDVVQITYSQALMITVK